MNLVENVKTVNNRINNLLTFIFYQMTNGVAEINFNSRNAVRDIGRQSLEELNGAYLYIAATVLESDGKVFLSLLLLATKHELAGSS